MTDNTAIADSHARTLGYSDFDDLMKRNEQLISSEIRRHCAADLQQFEALEKQVRQTLAQRVPQYKGKASVGSLVLVITRNICRSATA